LGAGLRKRIPPKRGNIRKRRRLDFVEDALRNSDVGDLDHAAMQTSRKKEMSGLAPEERNRELRVDGTSHHRSSGAVHAARQIDGDDGYRSGIHQIDDVARRALNVPVKSRTKQRIDNQVAFRKRFRRHRAYGAVPALCRQSGVTLQPLAFPNEANAYRQAALGQITRGNEAVAAIVT